MWWKKLSAKNLIFLLIAIVFPLFANTYYIQFVIIIILYAIAATSLRTVYLSGQLSVGHAAFLGIGAYASALLAMRLNLTPWITILAGAVIATITATFVGFLFSRIRAIYFAMVTLFFGVCILALINGFNSITGGTSGLVGIPPFGTLHVPGVFEINFVSSPMAYYYLFLLMAFLSFLILHSIENSRIGMCWKGIAQSPSVALSVGINEAGYRVLAFSIGGFFAGLSGGCLAHYNGVLSAGSFGVMASIELLAYVLVGGAKYFSGPSIGTIVLFVIPELFAGLEEYTPFTTAAAMVLVIFYMPDGIAGLPKQILSWLERRRKIKGYVS